MYWWTEAGPACRNPSLQFDVRNLPGYIEFPESAVAPPASAMQSMMAEYAHLGGIIQRAVLAGIDIMATHRAAQAMKDAERAARITSQPKFGGDLDLEIPF